MIVLVTFLVITVSSIPSESINDKEVIHFLAGLNSVASSLGEKFAAHHIP